MRITFEEIKNNETIRTYIKKADESLLSLGFTEHSFAHVTKVGVTAKNILLKLGYSEREAELAAIAGFMHDIGNVINRKDHAQSGAVMAFRILDNMHCDPEDTTRLAKSSQMRAYYFQARRTRPYKPHKRKNVATPTEGKE